MPGKKLDRYRIMALYRAIWLGCKKATFLMSKQEEGKLTLIEKIQLRLHLGICDYCTRFRKQVKLFTGNAQHTHEHEHTSMREEKKELIKELLKK